MNLIAILLSIFLSTTPTSSFLCDSNILNIKIINNQNGDFSIVNDLEKIDSGAFAVLEWKKNLMLPRTFLKGEISFSDNKWKWIYIEPDKAILIERKNSGKTIEYKCDAQENIS